MGFVGEIPFLGSIIFTSSDKLASLSKKGLEISISVGDYYDYVLGGASIVYGGES